MQERAAETRATLGALLKHWRQVHGKSQLELSMDTGISQRHLSFVESGRSAPSRDLLLSLADALSIPLRDQNALFLAAGYAPLFPETPMDAPQMRVVQLAIDRMLANQEPHPALVLNRYWDVVQANNAATRFFESFLDVRRWPKPRNLLRLTFDPEGLRPSIENWQEVALSLLQRLRREVPGGVVDQRLHALLAELRLFPGFTELERATVGQSPVLPIHFRRGDERFSYFSLVTTVGTPQFVTAEELRIECMFPFDASQTPPPARHDPS